MLIKSEFPVPHQVYLDARHYVEYKHVPFFDFFRHCVFGFVNRIGLKGGYFVHLVQDKEGTLTGYCSCGEADEDQLCGHAFALYLKLIDWPFERTNLSDEFDRFPLVRLLRKVGRRLFKEKLNPTTNPMLDLPQEIADPRLLNYWDLAGIENQLSRRDRKALERAKRLCRSVGEMAMLRKNFPSANVLFEESRFYPLCKLFFRLYNQDALKVSVQHAEEHQARLQVCTEDHVLFSWLMPIDLYLKGVGDDRDYWMERTAFEVRQQAAPISYQILFGDDNHLEIEPRILVNDDLNLGLDETQVPGKRGLYFHETMGYFRVQTGLSPFEMEHSDPGITVVDAQDVKAFLKNYRPTLEGLDRSLIDDPVFGEVVAEHFQQLRLELSDFNDGYFSYSMEAWLDDKRFKDDSLRALFREVGRYRKLAGKLFDASGYDGTYLKPLYEEGREATGLHVSELFRIMAFFKERLQVDTNELTEQVYEKLKRFDGPSPPSLEHTQLNLRDYQSLGYEWLYFLKSFGLGGLLCDQMGLGKTHQAMALLAAALAENSEARILVVAPTSVIYHWKDKLTCFCPNISAGIYHGSDRNAQSALRSFQVIISTYGTLRNDVDLFADQVFELLFFDEIQNLKNKSTKAYRSLSKLKGRCKIGLTGTPIENHIGELKSLMDLVFPGYLGTDGGFRRYFVDPITKFDSHSHKEQVRAMINPFTMRRSKSEVLLELPDKTEDVRHYKLGQYETELYKDVKAKGKKGLAASSSGAMHIFQVIAQLKQVCNHPALYFNNTDYTAYPSTKWDMFTELLDEALDSGEKLVVFTQYLGMVDIIRLYLNHKGLRHACITGQTRNREQEQQRFMTDENCRVFVGTVRAAGVGIDLTSGSILIHYDRWWNAAREEQATDRIHRIGQKKNVQIYKFIGVNTVEERINKIIERKGGLLEDIVAFDSDAVNKNFTMDELLEILS